MYHFKTPNTISHSASLHNLLQVLKVPILTIMHRSTIYMLLLAVYLITEISATETVDHSEAKDCVESCTEKCEPCDAPKTCDAETEIECGDEASTKGKFCSPHKICASKTCECKYSTA